MATEPEPKKEPAKKDANDGTPTYNFQGPVTIGRDFIGRDQYNQTIKNISNSTEFIAELQKLKAEIEGLKSQPNVDSAVTRRLDTAAGDVGDAIDESEKEQPDTGRIKSLLDGAKETMEKLGGSVTTAVQLGSTLANLAMMIKPLFGG